MVAVVAAAAGAEGAAVKREKNYKKWTVQGKKQNQTQGILIN